MATNNLDLLEELAERLLNCQVCEEFFDSKTFIPKILPCHHSFCEVCVLRMAQPGTFRCPICRRLVVVEKDKDGKPKPLPVDTTRISLIDFNHWARNRGKVLCSEGHGAVARCRDCSEYLCEGCLNAHRRVNITKDHVIVSLVEAAEVSPVVFAQNVEFCPNHGDEKLKVFCQTCQVALCSTCAISQHKDKDGHDIVDLKVILAVREKEVVGLCGDLEQRHKGLQGRLHQSITNMEAAETRYNQLFREVEEVFQHVATALQRRKTEVQEELKAMTSKEREQLQEQVVGVKSVMAAVQSTADYSRRVASLGLPTQVLGQRHTILDMVQEVDKQEATPLQSASAYLMDKMDLPLLIERVRKFGHCRRVDEEDCDPRTPNRHGCHGNPEGEACGADVDGGAMLPAAAAACPPSPSVLYVIPNLPIGCPVLQLDVGRCSPDCSVTPGGTLCNTTLVCSPRQRSTPAFPFPGTCTTDPVSSPGRHCYWQVRCTLTGKPRERVTLCEIGVATMEALQACDGSREIAVAKQCAYTVCLNRASSRIKARAYFQDKREILRADMGLYSPHSQAPIQCTLGFLLDSPRCRFHVLDVDRCKKLFDTDVVMNDALWPVLRVGLVSETGSEVRLELQTGRQVEMSDALIDMLLRLESKCM